MPTGNLPAEGKKIFEKVYKEAKTSSTCKNSPDVDACAARVAWTAVKNAGWKKDAQGKWHKSETLSEFSLRIERAVYDKATNERRWRAVASDTDEDSRQDSMSLELFNDFLKRIETKEPVPEEFQSEFWKGGMPYLSVSHYPDLNGAGVPGNIDAVYVDGSYLKAKGKFDDTPLGRKCFEAICTDLYGEKSESINDKVRISIAFLDWKHQHKSNGYVFDRTEGRDLCPECLAEMFTGESQGKIFLNGHLVHLAMTRVPVNKRTDMEVDKSMAEIKTRKDDAASIVGDDLAEDLEEKAKLVGKSETLVIKSDGENVTENVQETVTETVQENVITPEEAANAPVVDLTGDPGVEKFDGTIPVAVVAPIPDAKQNLPLGGATSLKDALALRDAKEAMWDVGDLWYMTQDIRDNIMADETIEDKAAAITALLDEFKAQIKSLSEVGEMTHDELISVIKSTIAEQIQMVVQPVVPIHPLDDAFATFRAAFDTLSNIDGEEAKLHAIQDPFNVLGQQIVAVVKSTVKLPEAPVAPGVTGDLASTISKAISDAMQPFAQKLDLVSTQLQGSSMVNGVPPRRSIQQKDLQDVQPVVKSSTPHLRAVIEKLT